MWSWLHVAASLGIFAVGGLVSIPTIDKLTSGGIDRVMLSGVVAGTWLMCLITFVAFRRGTRTRSWAPWVVLPALEFTIPFSAPISGSMIAFVVMLALSTLLVALFGMYFGGKYEAERLQKESGWKLLLKGPQRKEVQLVILTRLHEHLIGWEPNHRSIVILPESEIQATVPADSVLFTSKNRGSR